MTKKLLFLLTFINATLFLNAQCGPAYANTSTPYDFEDSFGQSFTTASSCSGTFTSIRIRNIENFTASIPPSPVTANVTLYQGNGDSGMLLGTLIGEDLSNNNVFDFSAQNITMQANTQYTIIVEEMGSLSTLRIQCNIDNPVYAEGSTFIDGTFVNGINIDFLVTIDDSTLSINDVETTEKTVQVYPNPTTNSIQLTSLQQKENYNILDIYGKKVARGTVKENEAINIQQLSKGVYFIQLEKRVLKFIKK